MMSAMHMEAAPASTHAHSWLLSALQLDWRRVLTMAAKKSASLLKRIGSSMGPPKMVNDA